MPPELARVAQELLASLPWSIVLPAGCGKTELIAAMAANVDVAGKPLLILTHTNAGVGVVRKRFTKYGVTPAQARVFTLDTWAKLFNDHFPLLGATADVPDETDVWAGIRLRANAAFASPHIGDVLTATYSAVLVDEYQDCSNVQHDLVLAMKQYLPVGVLGDPLQGIFDFGAGIINWEDVTTAFTPQTLPITPHRWTSRNPALGDWLLSVRPQLVADATLDLSASGTPIQWRRSSVGLSDEGRYCISAANTAGSQKQVMALFQIPAQGYNFARKLYGKFDVAEEIECKVVRKLMEAIDSGNSGAIAAAILKFTKECCVGNPPAFNAALIASYLQGNTKTYRGRDAKQAAVYSALNEVLATPTPQNIKTALAALKIAAQRVFRWEAWGVAMQTLEELAYSEDSALKTLHGIRSRSRYGGQRTKNSVSRTLLVKGQECDECIIVGADGMSARNLYVALSRGIDKVTVFSERPVITLGSY